MGGDIFQVCQCLAVAFRHYLQTLDHVVAGIDKHVASLRHADAPVARAQVHGGVRLADMSQSPREDI